MKIARLLFVASLLLVALAINHGESRIATGDLAASGDDTLQLVRQEDGAVERSCTLDAQEGRTIVEFPEDVVLTTRSQSANSFGPIYAPVSILAGTYDITLVSFDDHIQQPQEEDQTQESWFLQAENEEGDIVFESNAISDLPAAQNILEERVEEHLEITDITALSAWHVLGVGESDTAESIWPVCAAFDRVGSEPKQITLDPSKDNTLYDSAGDPLSNAAGQHFFVGNNNGGQSRRGIIAFDIAGNIPAGATINSVALTLHLSRTLSDSPQTVALHKLLADWGEGTSDALGREGDGIAATPGDATWIHRFFDTDIWANPGGDFVASASASIPVAGITGYTWGPTPQMVADVQGWLDDPSSNFGWSLKGNEAEFGTAKRFDSKENLVPGRRPVLTVEFTPPGSP